MKHFQTLFLRKSIEPILEFDTNVVKKILYSIEITENTEDTKFLKKIKKNIYEFKIKVGRFQARFLCFWDKYDGFETLVFTTQRFPGELFNINKDDVDVAEDIRREYFKATLNLNLNPKPIKLEELKDLYLGKLTSDYRIEYEYELRMETLGFIIKNARKKMNLTQDQLAKMVGTQRTQISKLESSTNSATIFTVMKALRILKTHVQFNIVFENEYFEII